MPDTQLQKTALDEYISKLVGGRFYVKESEVSVGTSTTQIVPNNFERLALLLVNVGSQQVTVKPSETVTYGDGIALLSNGSNLIVTAHDDLVLPGYGWYGIVNISTNNVYAIEVLRYQLSS